MMGESIRHILVNSTTTGSTFTYTEKVIITYNTCCYNKQRKDNFEEQISKTLKKKKKKKKKNHTSLQFCVLVKHIRFQKLFRN